ncbi:MAG: MrcB family domain-containing protein, partial [Paraclostridium sp.]
MSIVEKLKNTREGQGITLSELAKNLNWPVSKLSKIESGSQEVTVNELQEICESLGIDILDIMEGKINLALNYNNFEDSLVKKFIEAINSYGTVNRENFAGNETVKIITKVIPGLIAKSLGIDVQKFLVKGSGGNGQPAEVPWISIFMRDITKSATKGLYLVFLIKADFSG